MRQRLLLRRKGDDQCNDAWRIGGQPRTCDCAYYNRGTLTVLARWRVRHRPQRVAYGFIEPGCSTLSDKMEAR